MGTVLIIGAGGVGKVVVKKCAMNNDVFSNIILASRTLSKCVEIAVEVKEELGVEIAIAQVDADNVDETVSLINKFNPDLLINVALPYQDLTIMDACLKAGVNYLDTANYEPKDVAKFEYKWQWDYQERFKEKGLMALLGCGFDPGVTNVFCSYAQKNLFDEINTIDILDCNAGNHGKAFATNFNPEINIREVTQIVKHWNQGEWVETPAILEVGAVHFSFDYPEVGSKESYLLYHEEEESLVKHIKGLQRIRFWMTFSDQYINHLKVLQNVGMTRIDPVKYDGNEIIPLKFLKEVLPEPSTLAENYIGKTVIGCIMQGKKDGKQITKYIYNICDHSECYKEVKSQAVSYTTGVPTMIGAMLMLKGIWKGEGVFNIEQLNPDPFMDELYKQGLPWKITDFQGTLPN